MISDHEQRAFENIVSHYHDTDDAIVEQKSLSRWREHLGKAALFGASFTLVLGTNVHEHVAEFPRTVVESVVDVHNTLQGRGF